MAGVLAVLAVPAGIVLARETSVTLLQSGGSVAVAALLGFVAVIEARRGRERAQITLGRAGGDRLAGIGRILGILGVCIAATCALALAFFGLLTLFAE